MYLYVSVGLRLQGVIQKWSLKPHKCGYVGRRLIAINYLSNPSQPTTPALGCGSLGGGKPVA